MHRFRRKPGWLAVLALLIYGFAPLLAGAAPRKVAPAQCQAPTETHTCACRPDPHGAKQCCCAEGEPENGCKISQAPCQGDADPVIPLWTSAHHFMRTGGGIGVPFARPSAPEPHVTSGLRLAAAIPLTPPPQA
jgi:hypothetical protein